MVLLILIVSTPFVLLPFKSHLEQHLSLLRKNRFFLFFFHPREQVLILSNPGKGRSVSLSVHGPGHQWDRCQWACPIKRAKERERES